MHNQTPWMITKFIENSSFLKLYLALPLRHTMVSCGLFQTHLRLLGNLVSNPKKGNDYATVFTHFFFQFQQFLLPIIVPNIVSNKSDTI